ncbi:SanA/YdcF family protein [Actinobacillus genomosp. 1]|uniref:SanA/YdcF family protein n=1 Tax=Actinobacillus genomosp. 1 TaxID=254839 RepID=UPI0024433F36|nr:ElyC/SanA/YdcF family protein [Actinobacillus genomosp. 1]WGE91832.1 YdcF family protein [Actinobacillus genomosp. 1]
MELTQATESLPKTSLWKRCLSICPRIALVSFAIALFLSIAIFIIDYATGIYVKDNIYTDINKLPKHQNAVVLGTSKFYAKGTPNLYYKYRLEAAEKLIKNGKVERLLVSGDNKTPYYNEPKVMLNDLVRMGIGKEFIQQDFAGYRTLDSIVRASKVYRLESFVIITQKFHCERALFIAKYHGINAVCFVAKYPEGHIKVRLRELLARIGMIWDFMVRTEPETLENKKSQ